MRRHGGSSTNSSATRHWRSLRTTANSPTSAAWRFSRFGKGRHPARLNCGDCASYALAKKRNIPLLFKGSDFAKTDIVPALATPA